MKPWYRNSTLMMDDAEMEWLQRQDCAACAVWEWIKADCQKRGTAEVRTLSETEQTVVANRLGIDSPRFSQVSQFLHSLKWITKKGEIRGWAKWQSGRTPEEDAARKQLEYWKSKALELETLQTEKPAENGESPRVSHSLPNSPLEERRGDKSTESLSLCAREPRNPTFPKNLEEVTTEADMRGVPRNVAEEFWHHFEAAGWVDKHGHAIVKWRSKLMAWAKHQRSAPAEAAHKAAESGRADPFWRLKFEFDLVEKELKSMKNGKAADAMGTIHFSPEDKTRMATLKTRRAELKKALGV